MIVRMRSEIVSYVKVSDRWIWASCDRVIEVQAEGREGRAG